MVASPELITAVISGAVVAGLSQLMKGRFANYNSRVVVGVIAVVVALGYTAFMTFVPEAFKTEILNFLYASISSAAFIYSFIWKAFESKTKK